MRIFLILLLSGCAGTQYRSPEDEWRTAVTKVLLNCHTPQCVAMRAKLLTLMWEEIEDDRYEPQGQP